LPPELPRVAESWEIADLSPEVSSVVAQGPWAGRPLHQLLTEYRTPLLGPHATVERFPFLIKFLDAEQRLSVQVHPDEKTAACLGLPPAPKTEAWVILAAEENSRIWAGFRQSVNRGQVEAALANGTISELLHAARPQAGDCFFLPAGTVHALGGGLFVAEIQQPSDVTFRLYDWDRRDEQGRSRPLQIAEALEAIDWGQKPIFPVRAVPGPHPAAETLVRCPAFVINRWQLQQRTALPAGDLCRVLVVLSGTLSVAYSAGDYRAFLPPGECLLLPATCRNLLLEPKGKELAVFLEVHLP